MLSECRVEPSSDGQAGETRLKGQQGKEKEKEEAAVPCGDSQPAGSLRQVESGTKQSSSADLIGNMTTLDGGVEQRDKTQTLEDRKRFSHLIVNQESQCGVSASDVCVVEQHLQKSKPRGLPTCSYPDRGRKRQVEEPRGTGPFYFFGGTNGAEIVSNYCESRGWKRTYDKHRDDVKLKWCETKSSANYSNFREGKQLVYQIPNNKVLTTKIGLLSSLREYERVSSKVKHGQGLRRLSMEDFIPTTYRMDLRDEREAFFAQQEGVSNNESRMWICKPTGMNQGKGIFLLKNQEDVSAFRLKLQHMEDCQANGKVYHRQTQAHIVQHYIQRPLLLNRKKFDVRSYLLIACTAPYMVFFRHGYVRLTCDLYDPSSSNLSAHLTNQYMQKKNPLYSQLKEDTVWSMESFNTYVNDKFQVAKRLPRDWVLGAFAKRMQHIMTQCFFAVKSKLDCRLGFFDLIGCDFMVDEDFKVWLLEMNCNPALHTNCEVLKEVIPSTVVETLDLTLEIFNKCRLRQRILPLASQREFVLLYKSASTPDCVLACSKSNTNTEFHQKNTKKTQKSEPRMYKSGTEGNSVASPAISVNVLSNGGGRSGPRSSCRHSSSIATSPLHQNISAVQGCSHLHSSSNDMQTVRSKSTRPQVELKLGKCTLPHHLKDVDDMKHPKTQQKMRIVTSESSLFCDSPDTPSPGPTRPAGFIAEHEEECKGGTKTLEFKTKEEL
ncbi:protein polyglycylase TTLL10 isoform X2 [Amphiprion ocellaris]|uniref:Tubulin tyrosine ligase-like family, member 10 n=2 Tax=Amphiprion ocellaris TaxID=80972 RepID=A0A3Q1BNZ3_AMPOC|nr:protein polyglycylase TTLL10 isoform X2 [Amphiprion ocellaris]XP_035801499.2 protein polyglycylase TTLL10 isoform X2 [Amphiprion ocellaris]